MTGDAVSLLQRLVSYPSISGEESPIADFVEAWAGHWGIDVGRVEDNVFCWIGEGETALLLNSHLDVVPPSSDHPFDPFDPVLKDGQVFGRGAVDAKASGAAMLTALLNLSTGGWRPKDGRLVVALTACEETSRPKNGLQTLLPHLGKIDGAIVGEPTGLVPCFSQKGLLILELTAHGKAAHAARPEKGRNAIVQAARDILSLGEELFDRIHPQLGPVTTAVTTIAGGSARNVVPESCVCVVDIRTTPAYTHAEIIAAVERSVMSQVTVSSERYVPTSTPEPSLIATAVRSALPNATPIGSPTVSDWAFLGSIPTVKLGPGDSRLSHTGQESLSISELAAAASLYETVVRRFFEGADSNHQAPSYVVEEGR